MADKTPIKSDIQVFPMGRSITILMIFLFFFFAGFLPWTGWEAYKDTTSFASKMAWISVITFLSLWGLSYCVHLFKIRKSRIKMTLDGICRMEQDGNNNFLGWDKVTNLTESPGMQRLILLDRQSGNKISVDYQFVDFDKIREKVFEEYEKHLQIPSLPVTFGKLFLQPNYPMFFIIGLFSSILLIGETFGAGAIVPIPIILFFLAGILVLIGLYFMDEQSRIHSITLGDDALTLEWFFKKVVIPWPQINKIDWVYASNQSENRFSYAVINVKDGKKYVFSRVKPKLEAYITLKKYFEQRNKTAQ